MQEPAEKSVVKKKTPGKSPDRTANPGRGVAGWALLFVSVSVGMFFTGVLVGRHQVPVLYEKTDIEADLAKREDLPSNHVVGIVGTPMTRDSEASSGTSLEFYEVLRSPETDTVESRKKIPVKRPAVVKEKVSPPAAAQPVAIAAKPESAPEKEQRKPEPVAKKPEPVAKKPEPVARKPEPAPAATASSPAGTDKASGKYTVQVAAFKEEADAEKVVSDLRKKGFSAYRVAGAGKGGETWHRVRIGFFPDTGSARGLVDELNKNGMSAYVVSP